MCRKQLLCRRLRLLLVCQAGNADARDELNHTHKGRTSDVPVSHNSDKVTMRVGQSLLQAQHVGTASLQAT
jgi:hypothetical protein